MRQVDRLYVVVSFSNRKTKTGEKKLISYLLGDEDDIA
jgi:hypothetical protein